MKFLPVCIGCMVTLWGPLIFLALFPGNVSIPAAYVLNWSAAVLGGAVGAMATQRTQDRFMPAMLTGLWAGAMAVLFSPARENLVDVLSTMCVYGYFAVLGGMAVGVRRRLWG